MLSALFVTFVVTLALDKKQTPWEAGAVPNRRVLSSLFQPMMPQQIDSDLTQVFAFVTWFHVRILSDLERHTHVKNNDIQ